MRPNVFELGGAFSGELFYKIVVGLSGLGLVAALNAGCDKTPNAKPEVTSSALPACVDGLPPFSVNSGLPEIGYHHDKQCAAPTTDHPDSPQNVDPADPQYQIGPNHTFRAICVVNENSSLSVVIQNGAKRMVALSRDALDNLPPNIPQC